MYLQSCKSSFANKNKKWCKLLAMLRTKAAKGDTDKERKLENNPSEPESKWLKILLSYSDGIIIK